MLMKDEQRCNTVELNVEALEVQLARDKWKQIQYCTVGWPLDKFAYGCGVYLTGLCAELKQK